MRTRTLTPFLRDVDGEVGGKVRINEQTYILRHHNEKHLGCKRMFSSKPTGKNCSRNNPQKNN